MGLQQVMNTLNKDSAFRLVTVVKMKKLLTAANTKLAVSLGISNAAATALITTLTLGLSAAGGLSSFGINTAMRRESGGKKGEKNG